MDVTVEALRRIQLLAGLSEETLQRMAQATVRRAFSPGETIIVEGEPCRAAYFVAEGQVRVYRLAPDGREQVLARMGAGQAFNTVPPFQQSGVNHASAQAITATVAYALPADELRRLVTMCPDLALVILRDFADRLSGLVDLAADLSLRTVRGRLARFLLEHAEAGAVTRRWTQEEIAAHLGSVRDVVGRTLRAFADEGLVRMDRQRIVLLDRQRLEATAQLTLPQVRK